MESVIAFRTPEWDVRGLVVVQVCVFHTNQLGKYAVRPFDDLAYRFVEDLKLCGSSSCNRLCWYSVEMEVVAMCERLS